ncbi:MAG TPA: hypothetical protein VNP93_08625 [Gaiellaceae bacterium]|nr:hypothetical protein [Gaiellaceae bacterium]
MSTDAAQPEPKPRSRVRAWLDGLSARAKALGGLATLVSSVLAVVFLLLPNLKPEPTPGEGSATFAEPTLEQPVTFGQYLDRIELPKDVYSPEDLARPGVLAGFGLTIKGYKDRRLPLRWFVLDTVTHDLVDGQSKRHTFEPDRNTSPLTWSVWIPRPVGAGPFKAVFEIYPPGTQPGQPGSAPLDRTETETFAGA